MPLTPIALGLRSNPGRANADGAARLINCYAEDAGEEGKIRYPIYASEGFTSLQTVTSGGRFRGGIFFRNDEYIGVSGQRLYLGKSVPALLDLGSFPTSGTVSFARNRREPQPQIAVVSSDGLFRVIDGNTVAVSTPTQPSGTQFNGVAFMDGYFILTQANGEFYITGIDNGTVIDELDFATAEANPDGLVLPMTRGTDLVLFGTSSTEFWANTGNTDFPFERTNSAAFGLYAAGTAREVVMDGGDTADSIIFAATNPDGAYIGIRALSGYSASKISTFAVDRAIQAEATLTNLQASTWTINGHSFYAISGTNFTWVYDMTTGLWHERQSSGLNRWRISDCVHIGTSIVCGDYTNGQTYLMSPTTFASAASVANLYHSSDNGETFIGPRSQTIGGTTNRKQRFKWNRLGQSKEDGKVFKIEITNAVNENGTGVPMTIIPPHVHSYPYPMRFSTLYADIIPGSSQNARPKAVTGLAVDAVSVKG